ncbi:MAG: pyridoxal phosphate-dependent aminotransferase [Candidatus Omnitrophica bacterium]|nr:pyridoxal phosphate-dependent aminotransferase [Candidatus Omnitrophota bacterium]MDD5671691.1 pyridoxal phosphate-dependent aminotransferase [Candidatus Omnitrophota bacterium]
MHFSKRTDWTLTPNPLSQRLAELHQKGAPLLDLTISNPTLCGFKYLHEKLLKPLLCPQSLVYDPAPHGLLESRKALCAYYAGKGITVTPEQIFLTANTSEAYSFVFRLLADPQDALLAPQPSYPLLDYLAGLNDITIRRYPLHCAGGWKIDIETLAGQFYESNPRAVLVVHPNNPTGNYVNAEEHLMLNQLCESKETALIADEVFYDFNLNEGPVPAGSFAQNKNVLTFTLGGISKTLGLPQMKLSWLIVSGPAGIQAQAIERLEIISDTYLSASTPVQNALGPWLELQKGIHAEIRQRIIENHRSLCKALRGHPAIQILDSEGGWNAVLRMPDSLTDEDWALHLLEKTRVVVHPGYLYDFPDGAFVVLSLLPKTEIFKQGVEQILKGIG